MSPPSGACGGQYDTVDATSGQLLRKAFAEKNSWNHDRQHACIVVGSGYIWMCVISVASFFANQHALMLWKTFVFRLHLRTL